MAHLLFRAFSNFIPLLKILVSLALWTVYYRVGCNGPGSPFHVMVTHILLR